MAESADNQFIRICISEIERHYPEAQPGSWRQRELERFQQDLTDKTGVRLSLSTLKRLWKSQFAQLPHVATLDALAQFLDYQDWHHFKSSYTRKKPSQSTRAPFRRTPFVLSAVVIAVAVAVILIANVAFSPSPRPIRVNGEVEFAVDKTIAKGVPNTIMYRYDVQHVEADSFFIQQSWNKLMRQPISREQNLFASIYYVPGFHRGKLVANDSIIAVRTVHILTDGWLPFARFDYRDPVPVYLRPSREAGALTVEVTDFRQQIRSVSEKWNVAYTNIADFETSSDSFELEAALKLSDEVKLPCDYLEMRVVTEEHIFYVPVVTKGCEAGLRVKVGETILDGETHDLAGFGVNVFEWNHLHLSVKDRQTEIYVNGRHIQSMNFKQSFGGIKGLVFEFSGRGFVDYVTLSDASGIVMYHEHFEDPKDQMAIRKE